MTDKIEWRSIETAPKDNTEVIVLIRPKVIRLGWYFAPSSRSEGWRDENGREIKPTHWIPMPFPPKETMEEICSSSFPDHEAATNFLRDFTGSEGGIVRIDWYALRGRIADLISMTRVEERGKHQKLIFEIGQGGSDARAKALDEVAMRVGNLISNMQALDKFNLSYWTKIKEKEGLLNTDVNSLSGKDIK